MNVSMAERAGEGSVARPGIGEVGNASEVGCALVPGMAALPVDFGAALLRAQEGAPTSGVVLGVAAAAAPALDGAPLATPETTLERTDWSERTDAPERPDRRRSDEEAAAIGWSTMAACAPLPLVESPSIGPGLEAAQPVEPEALAGSSESTLGGVGAAGGGRKETGERTERGERGVGSERGEAGPQELHGHHHLGLEAAPLAPVEAPLVVELGLAPLGLVVDAAPLTATERDAAPADVKRESGALSGVSASSLASTTGGAALDGAGAAEPEAWQPAESGAEAFDSAALDDAEEDEPSEESSGDSGGAHGSFGEALFAHVADAAAELAGADPGANDPGSQGGDGTSGATDRTDQPLHHAQLGEARAEFVFGDGADRVSLTVAMEHGGISVHAQLGSSDVAAALMGATDELRRALERHGLSLSGFSASGDGNGGGRGQRGGRAAGVVLGRAQGAAVALRRGAVEERGPQRGVRVIV